MSERRSDAQAHEHVVDVSAYQVATDWKTVGERNPGLVACYAKASEGLGYVSPLRLSQTKGAASAGLATGAYHFARPSVGSAIAQADYFLKAQPKRVTLRPMLDVEWEQAPKGPPLVKWLTAFCERVHAKIGCRPLLYVSPGYWDEWVIHAGGLNAAAVAYFEKRLLWIAHYGVEHPRVPPPWTHYSLWQYTYTKHRAGFPHEVDDSYLALSLDRIRLSLAQRARVRLLGS